MKEPDLVVVALSLLVTVLGECLLQQAETTVADCFLTSCILARFWIGSHTMPGQLHSRPIPTSLGEGCMRV